MQQLQQLVSSVQDTYYDMARSIQQLQWLQLFMYSTQDNY